MSIDNFNPLLSKLEAVIDSDILNFEIKTKIFDSEEFYNLLRKLKQELKKQAVQLKLEIEQIETGTISLSATQQLLSLFVLHIPVAVAIFDQEMRCLIVSDRWITDYQLEKRKIIGHTLVEIFPEMPQIWQQEHQNCLTGRTATLQQSEKELSWQIYPWRDRQGQVAGLFVFSQADTEKNLLQAKLESCEAQMRAIFAGMNEFVFTIEQNSESVLILPTKFFDSYDTNLVNQIIDQTQVKIFDGAETENYQALIDQVLCTQQTAAMEYSLQINNFLIWFSVNISPISKNTVMCVARDITNRKETEQDSLFAEKELAQVTLQSIGDAVITADTTGKVKYINPIAVELTGWQATEAAGQYLTTVFQLTTEHTRKPIVNLIERVARRNQVCQLNAKNLLIACNGNEYAIEGLASPIKDRQGKLIGVVIVFRDVTKARRMARELSWQASHDPLTKLCNRRKFEEYIAIAIQDSQQNDTPHALCLLDLDRFKVVNDTCGHAAGDELLRQISKLLTKRIRTSDVFARIGGDEFGLLLHRCPLEIAEKIANQLREIIKDFRFLWKDKLFRLGVSIGLVAIKSTTEDLTSLLSTADAACYAAKEKGGNYVYLYHEQDTVVAQQRGERQWVEKLNRALEENPCLDALPSAPFLKETASHRFCLYAQKIVAVEEGSDCCHYEVLLRLIDNSGTLITPGIFLPAAERYGLMPAIDKWVISTFLAGYEIYCQSRQLQNFSNLYTINLSGASINNPEFGDFLQQQFARYHISPATICFEITETVAISSLEDAVILIKQLKDIGCLIALDDFGSGMSSLNYLKNLPIDYLKIDGSFVTNIANDKIDYATVECFSHISQIMNIKTIAEFVENKTILQNLKQIGIDYAQGYGIERPQPLIWA